MRYTDIVFDLYGTLVDIHTDENDLVWDKTALFLGYYGAKYTGESLKAEFHKRMAQHQAEAGQSYECYPDIPFEKVMAELFVHRGVIQNADALGVQAAQLFRICSTEYIRLYPNVLEALALLRRSGLRLWLLSNAQQVFTDYELRHLGLGQQLDGILFSSDYGCRKPHPRFYRALLEKYGLAPERCLMVGNDRQTDIAGAKALGMATLYMHTLLTPQEQEKADPMLHPAAAPEGTRHFEFEGDNWLELGPLILSLASPEKG